jgi:hypothetical protein
MKLFGNPIKGLVKTMLAFGFMSAMGVTPLFAQATNTLAGLVANNGTLTIGDKIFSGFSYTASGLTSFNPTNIIVTATGSNGIDYLTWSGNISLVSTGITSAVLLLKYIVTANRGVINMIDQSYSGSVTNGLLSVDETATSPGAPTAHSHLDAGFGPPDVSDPNVYPNGPFDIGENDLLSIVPAQTTLHVTKAISPAVISPSGGSVTITQVEQSFHQNSGTLANLVANNGTLTIGDKTFTNFTFEVTGLNSFNPTNIIVTATESNGVDYLTWSGNISLVSTGIATANLLLNYIVTANRGVINMIDQSYAGSTTNGLLSVDETAATDAFGGTVVGYSHLQIGDTNDPPAEPVQGDNLNVNPAQSVLYVTKAIGFGVISTSGGSVTITQVEQSFHQVIPPTLAIQLVNPTNPMMVKVLWPSSSTNWTLWQNTNLVTTNWSSNSLSISNDNTNKSITVSPATGNLFFRLSNP